MKKVWFVLFALTIVACVFDGGDKKKEDGTHSITLTGYLSALEKSEGTMYAWSLDMDSALPGHHDVWQNMVCEGEGYLRNETDTNYTYTGPDEMWLYVDFSVPRDTALARNFTRYRLVVTCPDSITLP